MQHQSSPLHTVGANNAQPTTMASYDSHNVLRQRVVEFRQRVMTIMACHRRPPHSGTRNDQGQGNVFSNG